ncbi:MAG: hypothetical protein JXA68_07025 [Ignavibacteriales bacterium]|nr:hypothetical protein [Ignavibacteriales bacterium]
MKVELDRKYDVVNMMITMHSILYQRYKTLDLAFKVMFLVTAIILNVITFMDFDLIPFIIYDEKNFRIWLNVFTFSVFILSVIFLLIEWQKKSDRHLHAKNSLTKLQNEIRTLSSRSDSLRTNAEVERLNEYYCTTFESISVIPERKFNKLKARHYKKLEMSKFIDKNKGKPYFVIKIKFLYKQFFKN